MAFTADKVRQGVQQAAAGGYSVDNSLRFNAPDQAYLNRTFGTPTNNKIWTCSFWFKIGVQSYSNEGQRFLYAGTAGSDEISINNNGQIEWFYNAGSNQLKTNALFRDPSAWYHIICTADTTQATSSDRMKMYVNGTQITDFATASYPGLNQTGQINKSSEAHNFGLSFWNSNGRMDGYLAEVHFIDGQALDPTSFGETGTYGEWKPIEVTGMTYGTNGFYLDFSNTGTKHTITVQGDVQHTTSPKKIGDSSIHFLHNGGTADILKLSSYPSDLVFSGDFTYEFWAYKDDTSSSGAVFGNNESGYGVPCQWRMMSTGNMSIHMNGSSTWSMASGFGTSTSYTASVWQHWALVRSGSTITLYRDGVSQATTTSSQAQTLQGSSTFVIGGSQGSDYYNGHLDEIRISNTARYTSGFTPSTTAFTDDANTMLLIHSDTTVFESTTFTDDSGVVGGLGNDASSNTNNWTVNNLAATDQMLDSPTNNFCTMNPLRSVGVVLSEGNLKVSELTNGEYVYGSMAMASGKWYWEGLPLANYPLGGIISNDITNASDSILHYLAASGGSAACWLDGTNYPGASGWSGEIAGYAFDADTGVFKIYQNNSLWKTLTLTPPNSIAASNYVPAAKPGDGTNATCMFNFGQDSSFAGNKTAQGNQDSNSIGDFYYTPPTGFLALCTSNLPDPAVIPSEHFNTVTYAGTGAAKSVTGVGFQPDITWFKQRDITRNHLLQDVVRGVSSFSHVDLTEADGTASNLITSFDSDGFSLGTSGYVNASSGTYVAWNWKAGGSDVLNENGTIDSQVSANADAGFSIVSYTGTGSNATVGHGLSVTPEMVIVKNRNYVANWACLHSGIASDYETDYIPLNNATTSWDNNAYWNDTKPTNSLFSVGTDNDVNRSGDAHIAYCFHSVDGYSKVGSYTGNGSSDGTFVYTSFKPKYVMIKSSTLTEQWNILDSERGAYNVIGEVLLADSSAAEVDSNRIDFTSNGFKIRAAFDNINNNGATFIYLAFAEVPFKFSNAR